MQAKEKSLQLANTSEQTSRDLATPSDSFTNPFKYKGVRAASVPMNSGLDLRPNSGSDKKTMNYEMLTKSNKRNEVQERYKKLLNNFHDLSSNEKLKVISPHKIVKVHHSNNSKNSTKKEMFSLPKTEISKIEPASIVFPTIDTSIRARTTINPGKRTAYSSNHASPGRKSRTEITEQNSPRFNKENSANKDLEHLEDNLVTLKKSSYVPVQNVFSDKETVEFNMEKYLRGRHAETSRTSVDTDTILNFKSRKLSARLDSTNDETIPKEGSLMKYFRGQKLKPKPITNQKIIVYKLYDDPPERAITSQTPNKEKEPIEIKDLSQQDFRPKTTSINQSRGESRGDSRASSIPKVRDRFGSTATSGFTYTRPSTQAGERLSTSFYKNSLHSVRFLDSSMMSEAQQPRRMTAFTPEAFDRARLNSAQDNRDVSPIIWEKNSDHKDSNSQHSSKQPKGTPELSVSSRLSTVRVSSRNNLMTAPLERKRSLAFKAESQDEIRFTENFEDKPAQAFEKVDEPHVYLSEAAKKTETDLIISDLNENNGEEILNNLGQAMRSKMRELEMAMLETAKVEGQFDPENAELYKNIALAEIIDIRGGVQLVKNENLEEKAIQEDIQNIRGDISKIEQKLESMKKEDEEAIVNIREKFENALKVSPHYLSELELEYLRAQFKNPITDKATGEKVDDIVCKLKFFKKIQRDIRLNVYKNAKYHKAGIGEYIVKNGKYGDLMYIILRGCVDIRINKTFPNGQSGEITISSLYDGQHFGDVSFVSKKRKVAFDPRVHTVKNLSQIKEELKKEDEAIIAKEKDRLGSINNRIMDKKKEEMNKKESAGLQIIEKIANDKKEDDNYIEEEDYEGENIKRFASIVTVEQTEFLTISRDKFNDILVSVLQKDIDEKVQILRIMDFFKNEETESLTPLANNLGNQTFTMGQRIIKTGECLNHLFIVAKGRCRIICEVIDKDLYYVPIFKKKLKPFKFQDYGGKDQVDIVENMKLNPTEFDKVKQRKDLLDGVEDRTFNNERYYDLKDIDAHKFRRHIVFREIGPGVYFGIKALRHLDDSEDENAIDPRRVSKLSIVAESPVVELYTLDRKSLIYLPDRIKNILLGGISQVNDHDEVDIEAEMKKHKSWHKFRHDLIKDVLSNTEKPGKVIPDAYKMY